jgi:3-deoxy-D-manno-octulosonic-acid transferase
VLRSLYRITGAGVHVFLGALAPLLRKLVPEMAIDARLGRIAIGATSATRPRVWIHAASVGEVQAAKALINALVERGVKADYLLTTMTRQGREVAQSQLPGIACLQAPLDTPRATVQAMEAIAPDLYICLETELWPTLLETLDRGGVPRLLLNGRMSARSCRGYRFIATTMAQMLNGFAGIGAISKQDAVRFQTFISGSTIKVCGNIKYAPSLTNPGQKQKEYTRQLNLEKTTVFLCGSTRTGEEELLLPVYLQLQQESDNPVVWVIAPRHLDRLPAVEKLLHKAGLGYNLFSSCLETKRTANIVLVDVMGRLAELYAAGDFVFCGGSLVEKGGHNIMEPIQMHRPVYFGLFMADYSDAASLVLGAQAGFQVGSAQELSELLTAHLKNPKPYHLACQKASALAASQQQAAEKQTNMVMELLAG